jgi:ABC-type lipoprotein export system ATPase subunit
MKYTDNQDEIISVCNIRKIYGGKEKVEAIQHADMKVNRGKFYAIMGPSGSGKSTLLHILGLLDNPVSGCIMMENKDISDLCDKEKSKLRMKKIGFIFQFFNLFPHLNARENVIFPMLINNKIASKDRKKVAFGLLEKVGMSHKEKALPRTLSGGEQQRIAIARALANNPECILADEPTGNVDLENENRILEIFRELCKEGKAVVVVTHNQGVADAADEVFYMKNGVLERGEIQ